MDSADYIAAIEQLNSDFLEERKSKAQKIGNAFLKYFAAISHLHFSKVLQLLRDNRAAKIIAKKYTKEIKSPLILPKDLNFREKKIVVYTCVVGNYDQIPEPLLKYDNVSFVAFVDNPDIFRNKSGQWSYKSIPQKLEAMSPTLKNRYLKFHPLELFGDYEYSIYIDGNIRVVSDIRTLIQNCGDKTGLAMHRHGARDCVYDEARVCLLYRRGSAKKIKEQMAKYCSEGFPKNYGLNEANVIVADLKNSQTPVLLNEWWNELLCAGSLRDQLAWPYVLWKNKLSVDDVGCLGVDVYTNAKFQINKHN